MEEIRICSRCGETKPISDYRPNQRGIRLTYCRTCYNKQCLEYNRRNREKVNARAAQWQRDNRQQANENAARWKEKQPPGVLAAQTKAFRDADPERHRQRERELYILNAATIKPRKNAQRRAAYHKDIEATRAQRNAQYAANKAYYKSLVHAHRAKKAGFEGRYSDDIIATILRLQKGKCPYCKKDIRKIFDVDHIVAISNGGSNTARNLQLTCPRCNRSKNNKDPMVFARSLGRLL